MVGERRCVFCLPRRQPGPGLSHPGADHAQGWKWPTGAGGQFPAKPQAGPVSHFYANVQDLLYPMKKILETEVQFWIKTLISLKYEVVSSFISSCLKKKKQLGLFICVILKGERLFGWRNRPLFSPHDSVFHIRHFLQNSYWQICKLVHIIRVFIIISLSSCWFFPLSVTKLLLKLPCWICLSLE